MNSRDETAVIPSGNPPDSCDVFTRFFILFVCFRVSGDSRRILGGWSGGWSADSRGIVGDTRGILGGGSGDSRGIARGLSGDTRGMERPPGSTDHLEIAVG